MTPLPGKEPTFNTATIVGIFAVLFISAVFFGDVLKGVVFDKQPEVSLEARCESGDLPASVCDGGEGANELKPPETSEPTPARLQGGPDDKACKREAARHGRAGCE